MLDEQTDQTRRDACIATLANRQHGAVSWRQLIIPVTTIARTLLDVSALLTAPSLTRTVEQTEIRRLFDLTAVEQTLARHPTHPGAARLRRALSLYRDGEFTRSELEHAFLALCDAHGIPRPLVNHTVEGREVDFF